MYIEQPLLFIALIVSAAAAGLLTYIFYREGKKILKDKHIKHPYRAFTLMIIYCIILSLSALCVFGHALSLIYT